MASVIINRHNGFWDSFVASSTLRSVQDIVLNDEQDVEENGK